MTNKHTAPLYECPDCHRTTGPSDCCRKIRAFETELAETKKESELQRFGRLRAQELVQEGIKVCDEFRTRAEKAEAEIKRLKEWMQQAKDSLTPASEVRD